MSANQVYRPQADLEGVEMSTMCHYFLDDSLLTALIQHNPQLTRSCRFLRCYRCLEPTGAEHFHVSFSNYFRM